MGPIKIICAMMLLISTASSDSEDNKQWKLRIQKEGISVYSSRVPDSQIDELKGECVLDASLKTVTEVMLDVSSYPQWVADCVEAQKFNCSERTVCNLYFALAMPWPVRDRDIVLQSSIDIMLSQGRIVGSVYALQEELVPAYKNRIRIKSMYGTWIFKRISSDKTTATFICWADPAGLIPAFIINIASIDIPYRTLKGLQRMVKKEKYIQAGYSFKFRDL